MGKIIYMPRMELVKDESTVEDVWQDWGIWDDENGAVEYAKKLKKEIKEGKWKDREQEGYTLEAAVEVIKGDSWSIIEIIEV